VAVDALGNVLVTDYNPSLGAQLLRFVSPFGDVTTLYSAPSAYAVAVDVEGALALMSPADCSLKQAALPLCPAGSFCPAYALTPCPPGAYSSAAGTDSSGFCTPCPNTTFSPAGAALCAAACPAGTFASSPASCLPCAAGSSSATGASICTLCAAGTYSLAAASSSCAACPSGTYSGLGATFCIDCPAGTASATVGAASNASCVRCATGAYSVAGALTCAFTAATCPAGTVVTPPAACEVWEAGAYCVATLARRGPSYAGPQYFSSLRDRLYAGFDVSGESYFCQGGVLCSPAGLAIDGTGVAYVADPAMHSILTIAANGTVSLFAGGGCPYCQGWADGAGTSAAFSWPLGVAVSPSRTIYVADSSNHRVRVIAPNGNTSTLAGSGGATWADGLGTLASFSYPTGVAVDAAGVLFVADSGNFRVRQVTADGVVSTLAGNGISAWVDGASAVASFVSPFAVAVDAAGGVYVADTPPPSSPGYQVDDSRIRYVAPDGAVSTLAGGGGAFLTWGASADGVGTSASFHYPAGLVIEAAGRVLVLDAGGNSVRAVAPSSKVTATVAGNNDQWAWASQDGVGTTARLNFPFGVAVGVDRTLLISESSGAIRKAFPLRVSVASMCSSANALDACSLAASLASPTTFSSLPAPCFLGFAAMYYSLPEPKYAAEPITMSSGAAAFGACGAVTLACATPPCTLFVGGRGLDIGYDPGARFFFGVPVGGTLRDALAAVSVPGATLTDLSLCTTALCNAPAADAGCTPPIPRYSSLACPNVAPPLAPAAVAIPCYSSVATPAPMLQTQAVAGNTLCATFTHVCTGAFFVAGACLGAAPNTTVRVFSDAATLGALFGGAGSTATRLSSELYSPANALRALVSGVSLCNEGGCNSPAADDCALYCVTTLAGSMSWGAADGIGTDASFTFPSSVAVDAGGDLLVADSGNNFIRKVTPGGMVSTLVGLGPELADGAGSATSLNFPTGVAVDSSGILLVWRTSRKKPAPGVNNTR
jgi:sugar lactone lactonase YvrE